MICHRCGALREEGGRLFYIVNIEAYPSPEIVETMDEGDAESAMAALCAEAGQFSQQELMDQVYRRLTLTLCPRCFRGWIEQPAGNVEEAQERGGR